MRAHIYALLLLALPGPSWDPAVQFNKQEIAIQGMYMCPAHVLREMYTTVVLTIQGGVCMEDLHTICYSHYTANDESLMRAYVPCNRQDHQPQIPTQAH